MRNIDSEIRNLEAEIADLQNAKNQIDSVFAELSDNDLKDAVVEYSTFVYIPHIEKLSGWPEFLTEKLCWILGEDVNASMVDMVRFTVYKEAATRFAEKVK